MTIAITLALLLRPGSFLIPLLVATNDLKNSDKLKCFITNDFSVKHILTYPSALRLGCFYNLKGERNYSLLSHHSKYW